MFVPRWWARYVMIVAAIVAALALLLVISPGRAAAPQVAGVALSGVTEIDAESFLRIAQEDAWVKSQTAGSDSRAVLPRVEARYIRAHVSAVRFETPAA